MNLIHYQSKPKNKSNRISFHASFWLSDSFGLLGRRFCPFWQPGAASMYLICYLTAWDCQGAHNGHSDSRGWWGGDFAFSASFLILNEIMHQVIRSSGQLVIWSSSHYHYFFNIATYGRTTSGSTGLLRRQKYLLSVAHRNLMWTKLLHHQYLLL